MYILRRIYILETANDDRTRVPVGQQPGRKVAQGVSARLFGGRNFSEWRHRARERAVKLSKLLSSLPMLPDDFGEGIEDPLPQERLRIE